MERSGYVYIMASGRNGAVYLGVTSDLAKRAWEHRNGIIKGFTEKYRCKFLVWYKVHDSIESARQRELQMKEWKRAWKLREIEGLNPEWDDLYDRVALP
ncbi:MULTISPECIES: GIY-YIG nuclease family protein [Sphingomonas]|uniref:GIY-YIG nuclease family protein n=1 Tax=Sphingomonas TaxID=13687 RepID=UPI00193C5AD8|nr:MULTISPECIES: GIY-YIG nuclease family protein [Sphingomonas]